MAPSSMETSPGPSHPVGRLPYASVCRDHGYVIGTIRMARGRPQESMDQHWRDSGHGWGVACMLLLSRRAAGLSCRPQFQGRKTETA